MPQLDKVTLFSQVFWLITTFIGFYLVVAKTFLQPIVTLLKIRSYYTIVPEAKKSPTVVSAALFQNMSSRIIGGYVETVDRVTSQQLVLRAVGLTSVSSSLKQTIALNFLKRGN